MSTLAEIEAAVPSLSAAELEHLEATLREVRRRNAPARPPSDLARFAGSVRVDADPLTWQRQIRQEWE